MSFEESLAIDQLVCLELVQPCRHFVCKPVATTPYSQKVALQLAVSPNATVCPTSHTAKLP